MNIPNFLSIFRLFLTLFFIIAVNKGSYRMALYLFLLQGISDMLDGFLARLMKEKTNLGAFLDPMADKVMLTASYIVLSTQGLIPLWLTSIILSRDFIIACGFLIIYKFSNLARPMPSLLSKFTTFAQMCTILYILWSGRGQYSTYFFFGTLAFTLMSGIHYIAKGIGILVNKKSFDNIETL